MDASHIKTSLSLPITTLFYHSRSLYRSTPPFHQSKMHFTSALALLSVMAFAVQTGNACTDLCGDAPDDATEGILLDLSAHLNLIFKLERNDVSFCGSKIAEYADDLHMTIDPNTIYTLSKDGHLLKGDTCDAPLKCTDYPKGAACECDPATGPIVNPQSSKCLDARNLAVVRNSSIHLSIRTSPPASIFKSLILRSCIALFIGTTCRSLHMRPSIAL